MRVLYVHHANAVSGAGISLATQLRHLGDNVDAYFWLHRRSQLAALLCAAPDRTHRDYAFALTHTTRYGPPGSRTLAAFHAAKAAAALPTLAWLVRRFRPDLLHLNETALTGQAVAAAALGLPMVMHARTVVDPETPGMRVMEQIAKRRPVRLLAVDPETRASLPPICHASSELLYNPVELAAPDANAALALRASWGIPPGAVVAGQLSSLHREKGIWTILQLAQRLCPQLINLHFVLAGDDSATAGEGPALRAAVADAGLADRVHLVGHQRDLGSVYAALDIVLCMFGEHLRAVGRTAYEAPMAARPLVATVPNPNTCQSVQHGVTGLAFAPADLDGVRDAITKLARSPEARTALGQRARKAIADRHDPQRHARRVHQIYSELTAAKLTAARAPTVKRP